MKVFYKITTFLFLFVHNVCAQQKIEIADTIVTLNGKEVYISFPAYIKGECPVVMAIHGSGREARSYIPNDKKSSAFYIHQRDLAVNSGFMFVVISNGSDTWGTDIGVKNLFMVYNYVCSTYNVQKKWILWATSAGGISLARFIKKNPDKVSKAIGTFPAYDLNDSFTRLKSARNAWKNDTVELKKINPVNYPEIFIKVPYLIFHGRDDQAVPLKLHSCRLQKDVNRRGGHIQLYVVYGGHSTSNWNVYDDNIITNFLLKP